MKSKSLLVLLTLALVLWGCAPASDAASPAAPTVEPPATLQVTPGPVTQTVANGRVTFTDSEIPFTLEYPEGWIMTTVAGGARRLTVYLITSLDYVPNISAAVPEGKTVIIVTPMNWSPANDLAAFADSQKQSWIENGNTLLSEEDILANNGAPAKYFVLDAPEARYYIVLAMAGDLYVALSGRGDADAVRQIGVTVR